MSKDLQAVLRDIGEMHSRIQQENYYELLGVDTSADSALIGSRFRDLARTWHVDRFSAYDLGANKTKVQEIFSALNTAARTLSNPEKRAEYDLAIDEGPDITSILEAETHFRTGKSRLQTGSHKGAHEAFKRACELKEDEDEYRAYFLYTEYLLLNKDEDGRCLDKGKTKQIFTDLDRISEKLKEKHWLLTFMGTVSMGMGDDRQAEELLSEALMVNSQDTDAKRLLRLLRTRRQNPKKKGFFEKLFGK